MDSAQIQNRRLSKRPIHWLAALVLGVSVFLGACSPSEPDPVTIFLELEALPSSASATASVLYGDTNNNRMQDAGEKNYDASGKGQWTVADSPVPVLVYQSSYLGTTYSLTNSRLRPTSVAPFDTVLTMAQNLLGPEQGVAYVSKLFSRSLGSINATGLTISDTTLFSNQQALAFWYLRQYQLLDTDWAPGKKDAYLLLKLLQDKPSFDAVPTRYGVDQLLAVLQVTQASINFSVQGGLFPEDACIGLEADGFKCM